MLKRTSSGKEAAWFFSMKFEGNLPSSLTSVSEKFTRVSLRIISQFTSDCATL